MVRMWRASGSVMPFHLSVLQAQVSPKIFSNKAKTLQIFAPFSLDATAVVILPIMLNDFNTVQALFTESPANQLDHESGRVTQE